MNVCFTAPWLIVHCFNYFTGLYYVIQPTNSRLVVSHVLRSDKSGPNLGALCGLPVTTSDRPTILLPRASPEKAAATTVTNQITEETSAMRVILLALGGLSALLIVSQLVMGQLILSGQVEWVKRHQHSGYLTVVIALVYIVLSLITIASMPKRDRG